MTGSVRRFFFAETSTSIELSGRSCTNQRRIVGANSGRSYPVTGSTAELTPTRKSQARSIGTEHCGRRVTTLFRIGDGFVDAMESYVRWDDRGQAFAFWRHEPTWNQSDAKEWTGFRFNYEVSADDRAAQNLLTKYTIAGPAYRSLKRRAAAVSFVHRGRLPRHRRARRERPLPASNTRTTLPAAK